MDSSHKMPPACIPIKRIPQTIVRHPNGERLDIAGLVYPFWTEVSILRLDKLNNQDNEYPPFS